jgi:chemotaxis methyl-accepting protein methylase
LGDVVDDHQFRRLLDGLGLSWTGYYKVRKGVKKRIVHHMQQSGCRSVDDYLTTIARDPELERECQRLLTVSISRFFRDRPVWEALEGSILPDLIAGGSRSIKVWSAGCARGEEAYSFVIIWDILASRFDRMPELETWATDLNPEAIEQAKAGVYSMSSLKETPRWVSDRYFTMMHKHRTFAVPATLKEGIRWAVHDLLRDDPPGEGFHIVFLRNNLLTYYEDLLLAGPLNRIVGSLASGGYLIIGAKESMKAVTTQLTPSPCHPKIFQKPLDTQAKVDGTRAQTSLHDSIQSLTIRDLIRYDQNSFRG